MADWALIRVVTHTDAVEAMTHHLSELGALGVSVLQEEADIGGSRVTVSGFYPMDDAVRRHAVDVRERLEELSQFGLNIDPGELALEPVENDDWETGWQSHFPPRRFGDRLLITPSWTPIPDEPPSAVVLLDPGMAFGTGGHPSTQLCLDALVDMDLRGVVVADIGVGSGILAISAIKLGAASVRAVDVDERVIPIARENAEKNGVEDRIQLSVGDVESLDGRFGLLLMNILADVILPALPAVAPRLTRGGTAVFAGIADHEAARVEDALGAGGWRIRDTRHGEGWTAFVTQYAGEDG
ncbi:50S ribosomal protein L11 methyltransferase [Candidatus Poribacteria bacterium]|nr:50S ribosomal protein L11 methyltransferase [Candidatus Poribacteria bacterium]